MMMDKSLKYNMSSVRSTVIILQGLVFKAFPTLKIAMSQNCYKYDHHNIFFSFTSNTNVLFVTQCQQEGCLWGGGGGGDI